jgi:predicted RNase H-like HicB family nuclease
MPVDSRKRHRTPPELPKPAPRIPQAPGFGHIKPLRQVLLYRGEDGLWVAECPSPAGYVSQGETQETALANLKEAVPAYVSALEAGNLPVPQGHFDARLVTV